MTYATRTDLETRYGADELTQRESMLAAGAVDRALADADALIDGYVGGRYTVPLSPVQAIVTSKACAIARYNILGDAVSDRARNDYTDAVAWLKDVQAGRAWLDNVAPTPGGAPAQTVEMVSSARAFSREGRP